MMIFEYYIRCVFIIYMIMCFKLKIYIITSNLNMCASPSPAPSNIDDLTRNIVVTT